MSKELKIPHQRLLWRLVANSGEGFNDAIEADKEPRDALVRAGLIEVEKRQKQSGKRKVQGNYIRLTESGWAWCNQNMAWQKPRGKAEQFLNALLQRLKVIFERQGTAASLADFINKSTPPEESSPSPPTPEAPHSPSLDDRIVAAYLELSDGRKAVRVRIADLRKRLADVPRDELTEGLRELSRRNALTLYPLDDPRQIAPEDQAAAIQSSTGVSQHIVYYGGIPS